MMFNTDVDNIEPRDQNYQSCLENAARLFDRKIYWLPPCIVTTSEPLAVTVARINRPGPLKNIGDMESYPALYAQPNPPSKNPQELGMNCPIRQW